MNLHQAEVITSMEDFVRSKLVILKPVEECWQPADFLPDPTREDLTTQVEQLQGAAAAIAVLLDDQ